MRDLVIWKITIAIQYDSAKNHVYRAIAAVSLIAACLPIRWSPNNDGLLLTLSRLNILIPIAVAAIWILFLSQEDDSASTTTYNVRDTQKSAVSFS